MDVLIDFKNLTLMMYLFLGTGFIILLNDFLNYKIVTIFLGLVLVTVTYFFLDNEEKIFLKKIKI
jgi:hypothetical protein